MAKEINNECNLCSQCGFYIQNSQNIDISGVSVNSNINNDTLVCEECKDIINNHYIKMY